MPDPAPLLLVIIDCRSASADSASNRPCHAETCLLKAALGERKRRLALRFGLGLDQVGETFGFGQVDPAVLESAAGEFAGFGQAQALDRGQRTEDGIDHGPAAMALKFHAIFAGRTRRTVEPEDQCSSSKSPELRMTKIAHRSGPGLGQRSRDQRSCFMRFGPADANDRDCRGRAAARQREDGVGRHRPSGEERRDHRGDVAGAIEDHLDRDPQDHRQPALGDPAVALDVARDETGGDAHQDHRQDQAEHRT